MKEKNKGLIIPLKREIARAGKATGKSEWTVKIMYRSFANAGRNCIQNVIL
jgi:hypothetical protein